MTVYPIEIDSSLNLPAAVDGISAVNAVTINRLREAIFAIEAELGVHPAGVHTTVRARLDALEAALDAFQAELDNLLTGGGLFTPGGDLDGTGTNQTVIGLQGIEVSGTNPTNGDALVFNGASWGPGTPNAAFTAAGDLSGNEVTQTVIALRGRPVAATAPANSNALIWNGTAWTPGAVVTDMTSIELSLVSGQNSTGLPSYQRVGGKSIDMSRYPLSLNGKTRSVILEADVQKTGTATSVDIQLMDITHSVVVTGTTLSSVSNALIKVASSALTVGSSSGNIRNDVETVYEIKIKMSGGTVSDQVYCTNARLLITYS